MQEQGQSQIVLQHQHHQIQQQSQQMQHLNQSMQQQNQQVQQQNQLQQQSQQMQHQLQQQSQQMQQGQSIPQQNPQLQQQSQQIQQQIPSDVAMSAPIGTMSVQVAPQSTITAMPPGSMAIQIPQSISSISQSGLQQQSGTTTITTMSTLQQQQALGTDWAQGRVQVIQQQPLQNATYLQQLYNPQSQLLMPGNLALHSAGVNPGSIQVIAAGKPFQQTGPHILTQGKQVLTAQGQTASFPGYTTIPTTNSQTLVIGQLGVISSQPNILPAQTTNGQSKQDLQKFAASCNRHGTVQQNQSMQFSPWQFGTSLPQNIWTASPQQPTLLATQNPIYIRGATPQDGTQSQQQAQHMFLQSPPPQQLQHHSQGAMSQTSGTVSMSVSQPDITVSTSIAGVIGKPRGLENVQSKGNVVSSPGSPRLLPNSPLRPASSVSTQTLGINQVTQSMQHKSQPKIRAKSVVGRGVGMKSDASNQFKPGVQHVTANRMILTSHGTLVSAGTQQKVLQQQQLQQHQQHQQQQHQSSQQHQQQIMNVHQPINIQQQQQISFQQQQLLQSRPQIMGVSMASVQQQTIPTSQQIQAINSSHQQMVSDRPTLPVLSMEVLQNCQPPISNQLSLPTSVNSLVVPPQMQSISPLPSNQGSTPMQTSLDSHNGKVSESPAEKMELSSVAAKNDVTTDPKIKQGSANETNVQSTNVEPNPTGLNVQGVPGVTVNGEGQAPLDDAKERSSLPKALVKPQLTNVLTHVIEGFVIQEASEPFPVNRSTLMTDSILDANKEKRLKLDLDDYSPSKKADLIGSNDDYSSCEFCGKVELKSKFKKSKRFCSPPCAKRFSASGGKRLDISSKDEDEEKNKGKSAIEIGSSGLESSLSPSKISESIQHMDVDDRVSDNVEVPKVNPLKWSATGVQRAWLSSERLCYLSKPVETPAHLVVLPPSFNGESQVAEVCNFIKALPGCCEYAEDFANQEIDGQALMLLREDHLMSAMSMKLGPALKIVAKIDLMRETKTDQQGNLEK